MRLKPAPYQASYAPNQALLDMARVAIDARWLALQNREEPCVVRLGVPVEQGQLSSFDGRFDAVVYGILQVLSGMEFEVDLSSFPDDLTSVSLDLLDRLLLAVGTELERRKTLVR